MKSVTPHFLWIFSLGTRANEIAEDTILNLQTGLRLWRTGNYTCIVLDGGCFVANQTIAIADLNKQWLMANEPSLKDSDFILDTAAVTTREHLVNMPQLFWQNGYSYWNVYGDHTIVSEKYHTWGIWLLLWERFRVRPRLHYSGQVLGWPGWCKRIFSLGYYFLFPKGNDWLGKREATKRRQAAAH